MSSFPTVGPHPLRRPNFFLLLRAGHSRRRYSQSPPNPRTPVVVPLPTYLTLSVPRPSPISTRRQGGPRIPVRLPPSCHSPEGQTSPFSTSLFVLQSPVKGPNLHSDRSRPVCPISHGGWVGTDGSGDPRRPYLRLGPYLSGAGTTPCEPSPERTTCRQKENPSVRSFPVLLEPERNGTPDPLLRPSVCPVFVPPLPRRLILCQRRSPVSGLGCPGWWKSDSTFAGDPLGTRRGGMCPGPP